MLSSVSTGGGENVVSDFCPVGKETNRWVVEPAVYAHVAVDVILNVI
jgi:hypothetical protein